MLSRYKRLVPRSHRVLIFHQGLPRPDWFIGAAEQPLDPRDPALQAQIAEVEARIDARVDDRSRRTGQQSARSPQPDPISPARDQSRTPR